MDRNYVELTGRVASSRYRSMPSGTLEVVVELEVGEETIPVVLRGEQALSLPREGEEMGVMGRLCSRSERIEVIAMKANIGGRRFILSFLRKRRR
jgi:hypothetical protein